MRAALAAAAVARRVFWWERTHPSAFPYQGRLLLEVTHPFITRERLREVLEPQPGERILEIGPGTGYYALPVAEWVGPDGRLSVLDVQQEYLDHTTERRLGEGDHERRLPSWRTRRRSPTATTPLTPRTS